MDTKFRTAEIQQTWSKLSVYIFNERHRDALRAALTDLDLNGDCTSVHSPESCKKLEISKVSLRSHSLRVLKYIMSDGVGDKFSLSVPIIAQLSAITHDVGKVPGRMPPSYFDRTDHLEPSARWVRENLQMLKKDELKIVVDAVGNHHGKKYDVKDMSVAARLTRADFKARREEEQIMGDMAVLKGEKIIVMPSYAPPIMPGVSVPREVFERKCDAPDPKAEEKNLAWFNVDKLASSLLWKINNPFVGMIIPAFSTNDGTCYISYDLLFETVKQMAVEACQVSYIYLIAESQAKKNNVLAYVAARLDEKEALNKDRILLPKTYFFGQYIIHFRDPKLKDRFGRYIPLVGKNLYHQGQLNKIRAKKYGRALGEITSVDIDSTDRRKK